MYHNHHTMGFTAKKFFVCFVISCSLSTFYNRMNDDEGTLIPFNSTDLITVRRSECIGRCFLEGYTVNVQCNYLNSTSIQYNCNMIGYPSRSGCFNDGHMNCTVDSPNAIGLTQAYIECERSATKQDLIFEDSCKIFYRLGYPTIPSSKHEMILGVNLVRRRLDRNLIIFVSFILLPSLLFMVFYCFY